VFTAFGGRCWTRLTRLNLPAAMPNVMVAFRLTAPLSILAVLLADYLLNGGGLGALMRHAGSFYMPDREWGAALLSTALSVLCFDLARRLQRAVTDRFT
jgi:NitT/TauT family transport system permease protein